jgi:hypothetical protein
MTSITFTRASTLAGAGLLAGCLLLTACGGSPTASSGAVASPPQAPANQAGHGGTGSNPAGTQANGAPAPGSATTGSAAAGAPGGVTAGQPAAKVLPFSPSIVYTASLTLRSANVLATAKRVIAIVTAAGGYTATENAVSAKSGGTVSLQVKVPVSAYAGVLAELSSPALGTQLALRQQAADVTQEVADVGSLVTSQQDAITALEGLLRRAGSISSLLQVQQEISGDQSSLESLEAQQRALDRETSYATITMTLLSPRHRAAAHHAHRHAARHGFLAGLTAGWRTLGRATVAVLTALGALLPFLIVVVILAGIGYATRRWLTRRKAGPTAVG